RRSRETPPLPEYDTTQIAYHIVRHPEIRHPDGYDLALGLARVEVQVPRTIDPEEGTDSGEAEGGSAGEPAGESPIDYGEFEDLLFGEDDTSGGLDAASDINWEELYSPEIRYLRFCYFDGSKWWDSWDVPGERPLPQLVMVTIGFDGCAPFGEEFGRTPNEEFCECLNRDPPDCERLPDEQHSMVVRVSRADPFFLSKPLREGQDVAEQVGAPEEGGG
ncbi:MAG: hypothetical protein MI702_01475, partial [Chlorobiales bacterium]|nr:hypothetical protein [Chlorobiales bacterium]